MGKIPDPVLKSSVLQMMAEDAKLGCLIGLLVILVTPKVIKSKPFFSGGRGGGYFCIDHFPARKREAEYYKLFVFEFELYCYFVFVILFFFNGYWNN